MLKRPSNVRVFGRDYLINYHSSVPLSPSTVGLCNNLAQVIDIDDDVSDLEKADSVLHETLHAILYTMKVGLSRDDEERFVSAAATGLMGVFQDNPEFASWITQQRTD